MQIQVYNAFVDIGLPRQKAEEFVMFVDQRIKDEVKHEVDLLRADVETKTAQLVTKKDLDTSLDRLKSELKQDFRNEFATKKDIADLRTELKTDISNLRSEILSNKVDMLKWYVATQIATLGFIFAFLKYFFHG